jgi:predicted RNase H-like HicB family nuclease
MSRKKLAAKPLSFGVVFEPDEGGWHVSIPSVKGCHAWGQSLGQARRNIREALACAVDVFGSEAQADEAAAGAVFEEELRLPPAVKAAVSRYQKAQASVARAKEDSAASARELAQSLSLRDAGELLGLSQEGVRKLLKAG